MDDGVGRAAINTSTEQQQQNKQHNKQFPAIPVASTAKLQRHLKREFGGMLEMLNADVIVNEAKVISTSKTLSKVKRKSACTPSSRCPNHKSEEATLYCSSCQLTICYICAFEIHKTHQTSPISHAADITRMALHGRKRRIEKVIAKMRTNRKSLETSSEEILKRIQSQFDQTISRLKRKEQEVMQELVSHKQKRADSLYSVQNHHEIQWGRIDAILKRQNDPEMLKEFNELTAEDNDVENIGASVEIQKPFLDLNPVQDEIEKIKIGGCRQSQANLSENGTEPHSNNGGLASFRQHKRLEFKLDEHTSHPALRIVSSGKTVELVGTEKNVGVGSRHGQSMTYPGSYGANKSFYSKHRRSNYSGDNKPKRMNFATVLGDSSITQGKTYWEVSVNRSMEYKIGVAYKHMQGSRTLADEQNSWTLCLTYPDRFSAIHKNSKDFVFIPSHAASKALKLARVGILLDYERGRLAFYNANTPAEKRHIYTFRTFFNRPVWPMLSLRHGKLQVMTGLGIPGTWSGKLNKSACLVVMFQGVGEPRNNVYKKKLD